jgi:acyl-CoA reductase-like NAD-dependent aldehyde dehydrogenase
MGIERRADADLLRLFDNPCSDIGEDVLLHVQMGARAATLTMIEENGTGGIRDGRVQVAIAEHDVRGFATELQGHLFQVARGSPDEREAIRAANDSVFGLGAALFTQDVTKGEHIAAHELEAGCCFVNAFVKSDPRLPFGGTKESGYGREFSCYGIKEFVNIKTVFIK